ncbi:MAG: hypothetical protein E3J56_15930 [Candidatus Aminicenantes bacterium]|nr:MAG: hypothetical protein E3J56_15930 [Candidatus Aminicenantes bacterium]
MEDEYLNKDEITKRYRVGRFIIDRGMRDRELEYIKFGRKILFKKSAVEKWLRVNTVVALTKDQLKKFKQLAKKETSKKK